MRILC